MVDELELQLAGNKSGLDNLLHAVEAGVDIESIVPRIKELERESEHLKRQIKKERSREVSKGQMWAASQEAARVILEFEESDEGRSDPRTKAPCSLDR